MRIASSLSLVPVLSRTRLPLVSVYEIPNVLAEIRRQQNSEVFRRPTTIAGNMRSAGFDVVPATPFLRFSSVVGSEGGKGIGISEVAKEWLRAQKSSSTGDEAKSKDPKKG
jgi:hypothetical protein